MSREEALINGLAGIGFGGAIGLLGRGLSRAARNVNLPLPRQLRRQCASFSADTLIATPDGDKPISEIEVGDVILAYSEATEEVDLYHVSATFQQQHNSTLDLTIDGETLHTTDEHPFYVVRDNEEQWVQAQHLHIGDSVLSGLGETGTVEDIIIINEPQMMYNLTVALVATYLVGDGQWVVHNVDLSGIGRIHGIIELLNPINREGRLERYINNLLRQAAEIQGLEHVLGYYDGEYVGNTRIAAEAPNIRKILIGRSVLLSRQQRQLRIASHELWHGELRVKNLRPINSGWGTPDYAIHEVTVERLAREGLIRHFGDRLSERERLASEAYEKAWLRHCP